MPDEKSSIPWPVWALVTVVVAFIPAYFSYKAIVDKPSTTPATNVEKPATNPAPNNDEPSAIPASGTDNTTVTPKKRIAVTSETPAEEVPDINEQFTQKVPGTWNGQYAMNGYNFNAFVSYASNGTFTGKTDVSDQSGMTVTYYYNGSWQMRNGIETFTVINSNNQLFLPSGTTSRSRILAIDDHKCEFIDETGVRRTFYRVN